jgi:hypothetical protein
MMNRPNSARTPTQVLRVAVWSLAIGLWLLPLVAMQFTAEVNWSGFDFLVWAIMLGSAGGLCELGLRISGSGAYRAGTAVAVMTGFFITWSNLAVGIIGNEDNPLNLIFFAVLLVGLIGTALARFEARGVARALTFTAVAQALTAMVALVADGAYIFVITAVFVAMWLFAAALFRKAADDARPTLAAG